VLTVAIEKGKNVAASYHLILASQIIHTGSLNWPAPQATFTERQK